MPVYKYVALRKGKSEKGSIEASNIKEARDLLRKMGLVPRQLNEEPLEKQKAVEQVPSLGLAEKIDFISTLQILLTSGISAVESLMFMEQEAAKDKIKKLSKILKEQIMAGSTFSDALARYPKVFGNIFIGLAKAGEEAGELEKTLDRIKGLLTKQANIKAKVIGTMMYPCFVIILAIIIILVMLIFVFPAFKGMFEQSGKELPWITATLINAGDFLKTYWFTLPIMLFGIVFLIILLATWEPAVKMIDRIILRVPLMSNLVMFSNYSNFLSVFSVSYDAGIPVVDCLHLSVATITNSVLRDKVSIAIGQVQQGVQVSQALRMTKVMPKMLLFMIQTGEQSGRLGDMLEKGVNFLDKTLDGIIDTLTKMIEPIMLLVIGGIVLVMAMAIYLPLFQSYMD